MEIKEDDQVKLIKWIFVNSVLVSACLSHIFAVPFLTYEPEMMNACNESQQRGFETLETTLWHTFDTEALEMAHFQLPCKSIL